MNPFKHDFGQKLTTDANGVEAGRGFIAHVKFEQPAAQSITAVLTASLTSEAQTITEGITDPDVPRNIKIKANAAGVTGDVVIHGTNINDDAISETIALNGNTEVQGNKAFKTITSIELPPETNAGTDTVSIGVANKLGLPYKLSFNTVLKAYRDGALEGTAPTVTVDPDNIENNTVLLNSALNGTDIDIILIV